MKAGTIFTALMGIFVMLVMVTGAVNYSFETMLFPYIIGVPVLVFCVIQFVREITVGRESLEGGETKNDKKNYLIGSAWIVGFILAIYLLGYLLAIPLFLLVYLKLHGDSWLFSVIVTAVFTGTIWGLFAMGLKVPLHHGIFFS